MLEPRAIPARIREELGIAAKGTKNAKKTQNQQKVTKAAKNGQPIE
jgi:hypothetical protein